MAVSAIELGKRVEERSENSFEMLKSQKDFASRAVPHARRIRPPTEVVVAHDWKK